MRTYIKDAKNNISKTITMQGWADSIRDHGKVTFVDLRDRTGKVQCVGVAKMQDISTEDVLSITGLVKERPENMVNPDAETGSIEIEVESYEILNSSKELPIPLNTDGHEINEEARLKYRYLDLRRARMQKILKLRSDLSFAFRSYLNKEEFVEVETPLLTKSTKEGARDFIVPSRYNKGKFYALPQSPQQSVN